MTDQTEAATKDIERRCQVCRHTKVTVDGRGTDHTCATCLGETRTHIKNLGIMSTALLGEAIRHRLDSNAVALAGPVADPEVWAYRHGALLAQRPDPRWLDDHVELLHPLWVLATWEREVRVHLDQVLSPGTSMPTLTEARAYLDQHLSRLAHDPNFSFDELAEDIKTCHNHVERVLHLEEHVDRGAPCPNCGRGDLVKDYASEADGGAKMDRWTCPKCQHWWSETDYRLRVAGGYLLHAHALTASQIHDQYRVPESTIRRWANTPIPGTNRCIVRKAGYDGQRRQLYDVDDVITQRDATATAEHVS